MNTKEKTLSLTVDYDGEQAVKQGLQTLMSSCDDLVKYLRETTNNLNM